MEIKRVYEYIIQEKISTGICSTDWMYYAYFDNDVVAFREASALSKDNPDREYRVIERTIIDTVVS